MGRFDRVLVLDFGGGCLSRFPANERRHTPLSKAPLPAPRIEIDWARPSGKALDIEHAFVTFVFQTVGDHVIHLRRNPSSNGRRWRQHQTCMLANDFKY